MYRKFIMLAIFGLTSIGLPSTSKDWQGTEKPDATVEERLGQLGRKYGVIFTIGEGVFESEHNDIARLRSYRYKPGEATDVSDALDDMAHSVPDFTWEKDAQNPRIYHIIDASVERIRSYALNQFVDDIDFSGPTYALVQALAAKGVPVSPYGTSVTGELSFIDFRSLGHIRARGLSVRDILTQFLPLDGRGSVLWIARTSMDGKDRTTYVRFMGAPPQQPAAKP
jgi:hypothetical protein